MSFVSVFLGWHLLFVSTGPILKSVVLHDWIKCKCTSTVFEIVCFCLTTHCCAISKRWQCVCVFVLIPLIFLVVSYFILLTPGYLVCLSPLDYCKSFLICYIWRTQFRVLCNPLPCWWYLSVVHLLVFRCLWPHSFSFIWFSLWDGKKLIGADLFLFS